MRTKTRQFVKMLCGALSLVVIALLSPSSVRAQSSTPEQAIALEQQGKLEEAAEAWRSVTAQNPKDAAAFASLGVVLSKEQKYTEAASAYKKALSLNPKLPGIHLNLGLAEFKQGHFAAAIAPFKAATSEDSHNQQATTLLGLSYYGAKQFKEASKYLDQASKSDPENVELHQLLANSCLWAKEYSCAVDEFKWIQQKDPNSAAAHMLMGEALDGLGRTVEAVKEFQSGIDAAPREPNLHFGLGYLYWKQHKYSDAKPLFDQELAIDSTHAQSLAYLGDIAMKEKATDKALPLLRKAVQLKDDIRIAHFDIGVILLEQKNYKDALVSLSRAEALDPAQPDAHYRLARLYRDTGDLSASQREMEKVRELHQKEEDVASKILATPPPPPQ
jgi:tetratricopeptide (TPR) repeat protein